MNLFRLAGDMTHLLSIILLLLKIRTMKSCAGISLKTQELYVMVFVTRYLDLFTNYVSFYNSVMKIVFLGTSISIVWYMRYHKVVKQTYNKDEDSFRHYILSLPCFLLALLIHRAFTVTEVLWTFSLYLEAVAILPQLVLLQRSRNIDNLTGNYVFLLGSYIVILGVVQCIQRKVPLQGSLPEGSIELSMNDSRITVLEDNLYGLLRAYRALYLVNWVYRFFTENHQVRWIPWLSGLIQTALYTDFFYYYLKSWKNREKFRLPA